MSAAGDELPYLALTVNGTKGQKAVITSIGLALDRHSALRIFSISASPRNSITTSDMPSSGVKVTMTMPPVALVRVRPSDVDVERRLLVEPDAVAASRPATSRGPSRSS